MIKIGKFLLGLLLLLPAYAAGRTVAEFILGTYVQNAARLPAEAWTLPAGILLWTFLYAVLPRPIRTYVLAHELSHALWGWIFGARVGRLRVSRKGGSVELSHTNVLITLAPYFFPFYTFIVLLAFGISTLFLDPAPALPAWAFGIGLTWGFHLTFTLSALGVLQPDIQEHGRLFSYTLIFLCNLLAPILWLLCLDQASLADITQRMIEYLIELPALAATAQPFFSS